MSLLLVYLLVGTQRYFRCGDGCRRRFWLAEGAEVGVDKMAVALDVGQRLPDDICLGEETLVSDEQEELLL